MLKLHSRPKNLSFSFASRSEQRRRCENRYRFTTMTTRRRVELGIFFAEKKAHKEKKRWTQQRNQSAKRATGHTKQTLWNWVENCVYFLRPNSGSAARGSILLNHIADRASESGDFKKKSPKAQNTSENSHIFFSKDLFGISLISFRRMLSSLFFFGRNVIKS